MAFFFLVFYGGDGRLWCSVLFYAVFSVSVCLVKGRQFCLMFPAMVVVFFFSCACSFWCLPERLCFGQRWWFQPLHVRLALLQVGYWGSWWFGGAVVAVVVI